MTAEILPSERVKDYGDATVFVGNANEKVERLLAATDSIFLDESPRAAMMCGMACEAFQNQILWIWPITSLTI